ncbi:hypothetical protein [Novosphingobium sp. NDB2Meth1]|uniref:phage protein n=1 Tax=Novosphingobium sp. NDB2Meth1 TaxID=1892847 RepID=UPI000930B4DD|nr:hypothetical protein [Novosphingobium sp. NDB2Meth1]
MANQFIRKAGLLIGDSSTAIDVSALHFSFRIKQAEVGVPQTASIRVYNLSDQTFQRIREYTRVELSAGYQRGAYGVIFSGEIIQAKAGRENAVDSYVDLIAAEGYSSHQQPISVTLARGATVLDVAKAAAAAMGRKLNVYTTTTPPQLPRGTVQYGMARRALTDAATKMGAIWFYSNDGIDLVAVDSPRAGEATVINGATGMIGWPEQTQDGIRVRCLLNPNLTLGDTIKLDNASVQAATFTTAYQQQVQNTNLPRPDADGLYRMYVIEHFGNTRGADWYSDIICLSLDPTTRGLSGIFQRYLF